MFNESLFTYISLVLFILGIFGNLWTVTCIIWIWWKKKYANRSVFQRMMIYLFPLSVADIIFLLIMTFEFHHYTFAPEWSYNTTTCKLMWGLEHVSKFVSNTILACVSFERYLAICKPITYRKNQFGKVLLIVIHLTCVICLATPVMFYADVLADDETNYELIDDSGDELKVGTLCRSNMPDTIYIYYVGILVIVCLLIPTFVTIYAYVKMILFLRKQSDTQIFVHAFRNRVLFLLFLAFILNLIGWGPFWCAIFSLAINKPFSFEVLEFLHVLPCFTSAFNWIPYALMNRELRSAFRCGRPNHNSISRDAHKDSTRTVYTLLRLLSKETDETAT